MAVIIGSKPLPHAPRLGANPITAVKKAVTSFVRDRKPAPLPYNGKSTSAKGGVNSKYFRGKIFRKTLINMRPQKSYIDRYKTFLSESYVEALQMQLNRRFRYAAGTHKNVGYATGNLSRSIKAKTTIKFDQNMKTGRIDINYSTIANYHDYGTVIKSGREAGKVPHWAIRAWMDIKISQGSFRIRTTVGEKASRRSKEYKLNGIAFAIMKKFQQERRPPVLKDWSNYSRNERLRINYQKLIKTKGAYHRSQIRKSITKNLNQS